MNRLEQSSLLSYLDREDEYWLVNLESMLENENLAINSIECDCVGMLTLKSSAKIAADLMVSPKNHHGIALGLKRAYEGDDLVEFKQLLSDVISVKSM